MLNYPASQFTNLSASAAAIIPDVEARQIRTCTFTSTDGSDRIVRLELQQSGVGILGALDVLVPANAGTDGATEIASASDLIDRILLPGQYYSARVLSGAGTFRCLVIYRGPAPTSSEDEVISLTTDMSNTNWMPGTIL